MEKAKNNVNEEKSNTKKCKVAESTKEDMDAFDFVTEFGTYEVQKTADTDNEFPAIAQSEMHKDS